MTHIFKCNPVSAKKKQKSIKKILPFAVEKVFISTFDLNQLCKIVLTEKY